MIDIFKFSFSFTLIVILHHVDIVPAGGHI